MGFVPLVYMYIMDSLSQKIFGDHFGEVSTCLDVMRSTESFTAGEVVLSSFSNDKDLKSRTLHMYVHRYMVEENALLLWHSYLSSEGYSVILEERNCDHSVSLKVV